MIDIAQLNDPEYRWYHKKELSSIMASSYERKIRGMIVLDYNELRQKNDNEIKEQTRHKLDWLKLKGLIDCIPDNQDRSQKKGHLQPKDRLHFEKRDKGVCYLCTSMYHYGSCNIYSYSESDYKLSHLHHIIPNGDVTDDNIFTLCTHCHQIVHIVMFKAGKWKYEKPL